MHLANNLVEAGAAVPPPEQLFTLNISALEVRGAAYDSLSSDESLEDQEEFLVITRNQDTDVYRLPKRTGYWNNDDECKIGI